MRACEFKKCVILSEAIKLFGLLLVASALVRAEQLPIKHYTTADGLPSSYVLRIVPDSRGFLWFCTRDGLSRFDGRVFVSYTVEHGLPDPTVNNLLETRSGAYWVATNGGGVCRFNPNPNKSKDGEARMSKRLFAVFPVGDQPASNRVNVVYEDRADRLWVGTDDGLFLLEESGGQVSFRRYDLGLQRPVVITSLVEDREGSLWIGSRSGLVRRLPDGNIIQKPLRPSQVYDRVRGLFEDDDGSLWVAHDAGVLVINPRPVNEFAVADLQLTTYQSKSQRLQNGKQRAMNLASAVEYFRWYTTADGLPHISPTAFHRSADGRMWIATASGLAVFDGSRFQSYKTAQGLADDAITSLAEDKDGNLWLGSAAGGVMKLAVNGLTSFDETDGLTQATTLRGPAVFEDNSGSLCVISRTQIINRFDGERFTVVRPHGSLHSSDAEVIDGGLVDRAGQYWFMSGRRLYRFPAVRRIEELANIQPSAVYAQRNWLRGEYAYPVFEDSRSDMWLATFGTESGLARWERAADQWHAYPLPAGLSPWTFASAFAEDRSGAIWIGFYYGGVARYSANGFALFTIENGFPAGGITSLYRDRSARIWIATNQGGLARIDDPQGAQPEVRVYTTDQGLSSVNVRCITEDLWGRIYAGTARGVDQLDLETGQVRHYTVSDGLASDFVMSAFRDHHGALWFGTRKGLSRLIPQRDTVSVAPPRVWIGALRVAGVPQPLSELGESEVYGLRIPPNQNQIQIEFFGLGFSAGESLRYQFMLEGADPDWSAPAIDRTVNYASLSPGNYRFLVRALSVEGTTSAVPAVISFRILHPVWQRWWFLTTAAFAISLGIYGLYRFRVGHLLKLERMRTRIATDLHDDIGASLSRMAIMSEVVKQQIGETDQVCTQRLAEIADTARELVDSMSDIVWSIDPHQDDLKSVAVHVRQFASDVLEAKGIKFDLQVPPEFENVRVAPEQRRNLFLIFKEAINNVARHAECASVSFVISISENQLVSEIRDDGRGFETAGLGQPKTNGDERAVGGLSNMKARANHLGGRLIVRSSPGKGTELILTVPLKELGA